MNAELWLIPLGFLVGAYGTLIGAGGGFVLMPILLLLYPSDSPEFLTSISLAVVFANAASGSFAYARLKRIDYKSGLLFSAATVPGAILGALTTSAIPRRLFDGVFGVVLIAAAIFLFIKSNGGRNPKQAAARGSFARQLTDASGVRHIFAYNPWTGVGVSLVVGYLSSLLGIGGGIIHVPVMTFLLDFPVHIATATSHFVLAAMAGTGTLVHVVKGSFTHGTAIVIYLAIGVIFGAQLGARLATRVHGVWIIRGLAIALCFVGVRIFMMSL